MKQDDYASTAEWYRAERDLAQATGAKLCLKIYDASHCGNSGEHAERQLEGRSHYFDASTRRYFGCRVLDLGERCGGLILTAVESVQHPSEGRLYRAVAFDMLGNTIHRTRDNQKDFNGYKTPKAARNELSKLSWDTETEAARVIALAIKNAESDLKRLKGE